MNKAPFPSVPHRISFWEVGRATCGVIQPFLCVRVCPRYIKLLTPDLDLARDSRVQFPRGGDYIDLKPVVD